MSKASRPNILFVTCDQWRGDCVGAAGHPTVKTPNIDGLASEGVLFRRHYAGAAPCAPARACLYTGRYQMTNRVCRNGTPLDGRHGNIAMAARALGYDPTLFGYTDVGPDPRRHASGDPLLTSYEGVLPGFTVRQLLPEHQKPWLSWLRARGIETGQGFPDIHRPAAGDPAAVTPAPPAYGADETPTAFLAGEFIRWLGEQDAGKPWFAHVSFISPHQPFIVPEPFNRMYDAADGPPFARGASWRAEAGVHPYLAREFNNQKRGKFRPGAKGKVRDWDETAMRTVRALYFGMVSEVDAQLGLIWQALKRQSAWADTVIVLTSDHGEMLGDHHMLGKGGFFEGSYHIPLIIRDPRRRKHTGAAVDLFTEAVDVAPTLMELMESSPPGHLDGRSLLPFLEGRRPLGWREAAHWEFDFRGLAPDGATGLAPQDCNLAVLRGERWKYVHFGGGLPPLLYDLDADPHELENRAEDPACLRIRLEFAETLLRWRARHLDQSLAMVGLTPKGVVAPGASTAWPY